MPSVNCQNCGETTIKSISGYKESIKNRLNFFCSIKCRYSYQEIGTELDFYFPELKLAAEINGFLHFKPIYGLDKLKRIKEIEADKVKKCRKLRIALHIIDVSQEFHLSITIKENHWKTVKELVASR